MPAWNVHTSVSVNNYLVSGRSPAPVFDPATQMAALEADLVFRGTRAQVEEAFEFGKVNAPNGGPGMFSMSPVSIEMVPYTEDDPHWDVRGKWVGIHTDIAPPGGDYAYNYTIEYGSRTTEFPIVLDKEDGTKLIMENPDGFTPGHVNPFSTLQYRGRRRDWVPVLHVSAVSRSPIPPHPSHPHVLAILTAVPPTLAHISGVLENYTVLPDPVFVTWKGNPAQAIVNPTNLPQGKTWFPVITPVDRIPNPSGGAALHVFRMDCVLEQDVQP